MTIEMKIIIEEDDTGVGTRITGEGPCSAAEGEHAQFICKTLIAALKRRKKIKRHKPDVCRIKEINATTKKGNKNVH